MAGAEPAASDVAVVKTALPASDAPVVTIRGIAATECDRQIRPIGAALPQPPNRSFED